MDKSQYIPIHGRTTGVNGQVPVNSSSRTDWGSIWARPVYSNAWT